MSELGPLATLPLARLTRPAAAAVRGTHPPTPLRELLTEVALVAAAHGIDPVPDPDDFAIQRSPAGMTVATYLDAGHAIAVTLHGDGTADIAIGPVAWTYHETTPAARPALVAHHRPAGDPQ